MSDESNNERFIAVVLTPSIPSVDPAAIVDAIAHSFPKLAPVDLTAQSRTPENGFVIQVAGAPVTLRCVDAPLPPHRLERAAQTSLNWRGARDAVAGHSGHIVVAPIAANTQKTSGPLAAVTTIVAAAVADATDALGAYWASADCLVSSEAVAKGAARSAGGSPAFDLWVKLMPVKGPAGEDGRPTTGYISSGYKSFTGREVELAPVDMERGRIAGRLFAFMGVAYSKPDAVGGSSRIKVSDAEWISVSLEDSNRFTNEPVYRLTIAAEPEPAAAPAPAPAPFSPSREPQTEMEDRAPHGLNEAPDPGRPPPSRQPVQEPARTVAADATPPTTEPSTQMTPEKPSSGVLGRFFGKRK